MTEPKQEDGWKTVEGVPDLKYRETSANEESHSSDCSLHNGPAEKPQPCDCGKINIVQDGHDENGNPMWCATLPDFINLAESPAGFSIRKDVAILNLGREIGKKETEWFPISTAPRDKAIMICGGEVRRDDFQYDNKWPWEASYHEGWDGFDWRGENSGGHDEYYLFKPTHWTHCLFPLTRPANEET